MILACYTKKIRLEATKDPQISFYQYKISMEYILKKKQRFEPRNLDAKATALPLGQVPKNMEVVKIH